MPGRERIPNLESWFVIWVGQLISELHKQGIPLIIRGSARYPNWSRFGVRKRKIVALIIAAIHAQRIGPGLAGVG